MAENYNIENGKGKGVKRSYQEIIENCMPEQSDEHWPYFEWLWDAAVFMDKYNGMPLAKWNANEDYTMVWISLCQDVDIALDNFRDVVPEPAKKVGKIFLNREFVTATPEELAREHAEDMKKVDDNFNFRPHYLGLR